MKRQTLFYIALILALGVMMYIGREMFTTTITIPDAPPGPQGPPGPPGPQGPTGLTGYDGSSTTKSASSVSEGGKSIKGAAFAALTSDSSLTDRIKALTTDSLKAGAGSNQDCAKKLSYTDQCTVTGYCGERGWCEVSPRDRLDYKVINQAQFDEMVAKMAK
jgi:hypothetical protein